MIPEWLIGAFVWLLGLTIGSFLNVVIYRLPLDIPLGKPARSFCPHCRSPIAWYDNLPVLGWLLLRGRCRNCGDPISAQYPLVEALTGLVFVAVYYLLAVAHAQDGVDSFRWPGDAPLLLAWLTLAAAMIACAATDILSYMVDTRITNVAMYGGLILMAVWPDPSLSATGDRATPLAAAAVGMFLMSGLMLWRTVWSAAAEDAAQPQADNTAGGASAAAQAGTAVGKDAVHPQNDGGHPGSAFTAVAVSAVVATIGVTLWLLASTAGAPTTPAAIRAPAAIERGVNADGPGVSPLWLRRDYAPISSNRAPFLVSFGLLFVAMVVAGGQHRAVDAELHEAIAAEQDDARKMAISEMLWLTPIVLAGAACYALVAYLPVVAALWRDATAWQPLGGVFPIAGATNAIIGLIVAAGAGWALRLVFTLALGREAFGTGDIFILAAAGACAGWDIAIGGLALSIGIALAGWLIGQLLKQTSIIPFGPWLAIGFLGALWLNRPLNAIVREHYENVCDVAKTQPELVWSGAAILLAGGVIAVVAARLLRRSLESQKS